MLTPAPRHRQSARTRAECGACKSTCSLAASRTCALLMSSSFRPVAYSIAWLAPWLFGCVIRCEYLFSGAEARVTQVARCLRWHRWPEAASCG